jgi:phage recombination protein Bet
MTAVATIQPAKRSIVNDMAERYGMEPKHFCDTICATVFPREGTNEEFMAFLLVAREYGLNPITKEIYAFPKKGGGIQPIVSVDGWCNIINSHPQTDGIKFEDVFDDKGKLFKVTCRIWRKDRAHPTECAEYFEECARGTDPWKQYPRRMLRHKALIQCARYAFGFAGIVDPDEAERIGVVPMRDVTPPDDDGPPATHGAKPAPAAPLRGDVEATAGDVFDGAEWLRNLEGAFSGCEDLTGLFKAHEKLYTPHAGKALPPDRAKALALREDHIKRLTAEG